MSEQEMTRRLPAIGSLEFCEDGRRKDFYKDPVEDAILMSCELR